MMAQASVGPAIKTATTAQPLSREPPVELDGEHRPSRSAGDGHGLAIAHVLLSAAVAAGTMSGCESDGLVEEEQGGPAVGRRQRLPVVPELEPTRDPERTVVVPDDGTVVVDETATVPGEAAASSHCMEIAPRINPVSAGAHVGPIRPDGRP